MKPMMMLTFAMRYVHRWQVNLWYVDPTRDQNLVQSSSVQAVGFLGLFPESLARDTDSVIGGHWEPCGQARKVTRCVTVTLWKNQQAQILVSTILHGTMDETTPPPPPDEQSPPPPPPLHTGSPTDFLKGVVGKRVIVRLTSGVDYRGAS
jgi:hypothetical protein